MFRKVLGRTVRGGVPRERKRFAERPKVGKAVLNLLHMAAIMKLSRLLRRTQKMMGEELQVEAQVMVTDHIFVKRSSRLYNDWAACHKLSFRMFISAATKNGILRSVVISMTTQRRVISFIRERPDVTITVMSARGTEGHTTSIVEVRECFIMTLDHDKPKHHQSQMRVSYLAESSQSGLEVHDRHSATFILCWGHQWHSSGMRDMNAIAFHIRNLFSMFSNM